MSEVVVIAQFKAKPASETALEKALRAAIEPTHLEEGCIRYALHRSVEKPDVYCFVERWRSKADLDEHLKKAHIKTLFGKLDELTLDSSLEILEALPHGHAEKGRI